jgi:hypothetical protein
VRQPGHRTFATHGLRISARQPQLAFEDVEQFVLGIMAVQRRSDVPRGEELHRCQRALRLLTGDFGGVERVQEMEAFTFVTGNQNWTHCHGSSLYCGTALFVPVS